MAKKDEHDTKRDDPSQPITERELAIARVTANPLTTREHIFTLRVFEGVGSINAYRACFNVAGATDVTVEKRANQLLNKENVKFELARMREQAARIAKIDVATVVEEIRDLAFADQHDAYKVKAYCCRHCWGIEFNYQWKDAHEFNYAVQSYEAAQKEARARGMFMQIPPPNDEGGYEFKKNMPPNPDCPECDGDGSDVKVVLKPTDKWKPATRRLVAGIKEGKNGIEIAWRDQTRVLTMLAEHLGAIGNRPLVQLINGAMPSSVAMGDTTPEPLAQDLSGMSDEELAQLKGLLARAVGNRDNSGAVDVPSRVVRQENTLPVDLPTTTNVSRRGPGSNTSGG